MKRRCIHTGRLGDQPPPESQYRTALQRLSADRPVYAARDRDGNKLDSTVYRGGQEVRSYGGPEPRLLLRYAWNDRESVKASVARNNQYIHLVTNAGSTLPTDIWVPSTYLVKPQFSWQYSAGYFRNFADNSWEASVEAYYKDLRNQVEYREGYTPSLKDPEEEFVFGKGICLRGGAVHPQK